MYEDLKGKTALVAGAARRRGLGFAIARALARQGAAVCLADRDAEVLERARELEAAGAVACGVVADIRSDGATETLRATFAARHPRLDILILCVGRMHGQGRVAEFSPEAWLETQEVNLFGAFRMLHAFLPLMRDKGGSVIALASGAGKRPLPGFSGYSVSKAGLIMLLKCVAVEYAACGVRANAICPGPVESDMVEERIAAEAASAGVPPDERRAALCRGIPLGRMATADDIAAAALFLASDASAYITGQALNLSGGMITEL